MSLLPRLRKHWRAGIATIVATATLAGGITAAFAGDAGPVFTGKVGGGNGAGVVPGSTMDFGWFYQDTFGALNDDTVKHFMDSNNWRHQSNGGDDLIHQTVQQAASQANARHAKNPRIVGIGLMIGHVDGVDYFDNITRNPAITSQDWKNAWQTAVGGKEFTSTSGLKYRTSTKWAGENYSIDDIANNLMSDANGYTELMIIALGENEPALTYHVDVSTNTHPGNMYLRNNEPVYDTVHTRVTKGQWPAGNRLNATVWFNYEPGKTFLLTANLPSCSLRT